jgi:hypothetical protein
MVLRVLVSKGLAFMINKSLETLEAVVADSSKLCLIRFKFDMIHKWVHAAMGLYTSGRLIEYAWVLRNLQFISGLVLDVGCTGSYLHGVLIQRGLNVWGIDSRNFRDRHPALVFQRGDIIRTPFLMSFLIRYLPYQLLNTWG